MRRITRAIILHRIKRFSDFFSANLSQPVAISSILFWFFWTLLFSPLEYCVSPDLLQVTQICVVSSWVLVVELVVVELFTKVKGLLKERLYYVTSFSLPCYFWQNTRWLGLWIRQSGGRWASNRDQNSLGLIYTVLVGWFGDLVWWFDVVDILQGELLGLVFRD